MGWLFGKKKVPRVPFPEGKPLDEKMFDAGALRLPGKISRDGRNKVIEPESLKAAAGFDQPLDLPEDTDFNLPELKEELPEERKEAPRLRNPFPRSSPSPFFGQSSNPLYVKVEVYQRLLGELNDMKNNLGTLHLINQKIGTSEYNEEGNFNKLKGEIKSMHDRLLLVDKTLFKA